MVLGTLLALVGEHAMVRISVSSDVCPQKQRWKHEKKSAEVRPMLHRGTMSQNMDWKHCDVTDCVIGGNIT